MSFAQKFWMPKRIIIAGLVMIATLIVAILVQTYTHFNTVPFVRTVAYYLFLDYAWATIRREWFDGKA